MGQLQGFSIQQRVLGKSECPLSPFLFLIITEGLSRAILEAKSRGVIFEVKMGIDFSFTHLLFVDDVLILYKGALS